MKLYRALTKDGKMVYGWYAEVEGRHLIIPSFRESDAKSRPYINTGNYNTYNIHKAIQVIPETVAQQVGRQDKNDDEIYVDAILRRSWDFRTPHKTHRYGSEVGLVVQGISGAYCFENVEGLNPEGSTDLWEINKNCEIIGDIHRNPKLLEKSK